MNTKTFCRNLSLIMLVACVCLGAWGTQGLAVIWTEDFQGYADTAALKTAYTQATNGGAFLAAPSTTNDISLVADPDAVSGNCLMFNVIPSLSSQAANYYLFYWYYTGTGTSNPFPTNTFQNGTDFNVRYDVRTTSFTGGAGNLSHKVGGVATCMGAWTLTTASAPFIANRGHIQTISAQDAWTQLFAAFRSQDQRLGTANSNVNNGNNGVGFTPVLQTPNVWYTCRFTVNWPNDGVTTNQNATCTFTIWQRGSAEPGSPTCTYNSPNAWTGDAAIMKGASGATTGDGYGVWGLFQDPGGSGVTYQQYIDNVVFQDSLTPVGDWDKY